MVVGFTGTQHGMTPKQRAAVAGLLDISKPNQAHHGDCVGADAEFHRMCGWRQIPMVIHPPVKNIKRAYCGGLMVVVLSPKDYLERNRNIVKSSDILIATPCGGEVLRSGTWSTIRYAKKIGRPVYLALPSGDVVYPDRKTSGSVSVISSQPGLF